MTLCVAALAKMPNASLEKMNVAVFAADLQSEGEVAKAEISRKVLQVGRDRHFVLLAGTYSRARDLAITISTKLKEPSQLSVGCKHLLERAVADQKHHLANEYTSGTLGMSYDEFLRIGKEKLPDDVYREMIYAISRQTLDCTLLVVTFAQVKPILYRIHESGMVENCEHFAAIGTGYYIAESALFQREQNEDEDVGMTMYNVYEAMRLGAYAPSVSSRFQMWLAEWEYDHEEGDEEVTDEGCVMRIDVLPPYYSFLENHYRKFGPKKVSNVEFKADLVEKEELRMMVTPLGAKEIRDAKAAEDALNLPESQRIISSEKKRDQKPTPQNPKKPKDKR